MLTYCHSGCDFVDILNALKGKGLVEGVGEYSPPDPAELMRRHAHETADRERRNRQTRKLWAEAKPIAGTIAETYLRGRAITCALPDTLRFHPACWHSSGRHIPAMVGLIQGAKGFALHRTYLQPDGSGKASVTPSKAMLGQTRGGAVRLSAGAGPLVVSEGIERQACPYLAGCWTALCRSGQHFPVRECKASPCQTTLTA